MDEDSITSNMVRRCLPKKTMVHRLSSRTRKVATQMVAALASSDNRTQGALARLEALENDYPGAEMIEIYSDDDASLDGEDQG
ncbi:hypothetical protein RHGRI_031408 [Rhododendron griersonianum]|nr:hypothetical protein RHGRI_031408 [Rhododendron griersonianum]